MLREVGKIYSRALRMIFQHPQFIRLSVAYLLINYAVGYIDLRVKTFNSLVLIVFMDWVWLVVDFILFAGFPLALMLMVNQCENGIDLKVIFLETREYFWKFVRQSLAGFLLSLAYTLPVFCLVLFSVFMDNTLFVTIIIPLWLLVFGFLSFGSITLGQRILLDGGEGAFQNSLKGLRVLNGNFAFFVSLYFLHALISTAHLSSGFLLGSVITGVDLFAVPITSFSLFVKNIFAATQTPLVIGWNMILGIILYPFYIIVPTLAYLRVKNNEILPSSRRRKLMTEN
jgi:hypothetical protein